MESEVFHFYSKRRWNTVQGALAARRGELKATEQEHYVKTHSYQVSTLT